MSQEARIIVLNAVTSSAPQGIASSFRDAVETCPFCAEEVHEAAIVCKHCGRNLPAPPPVAVPIEDAAKKRSATPYILGGVALFIVGFLINQYRAANPSTLPQETIPLAAQARASSLILELTNAGNDDWINVDVTIRNRAGGTGYRLHRDRITGRATEKIWLREFADQMVTASPSC